MVEKIDLGDWDILSHTHYYNRNPFSKISTIIIENDSGDYFFIEDEYDKIIDVTKMPDYIRKDWVNYNKKDLTISLLNKQIGWFENYLEDSANVMLKELDKIKETIKILKSLRRDLIIKGII